MAREGMDIMSHGWHHDLLFPHKGNLKKIHKILPSLLDLLLPTFSVSYLQIQQTPRDALTC